MDLDVRYIIRETLVSSLELSEKVLEALGLSKSKAVDTVRRFRAHDEETMAKQLAVKDDEKKFLADRARIGGAAVAPVRGRRRRHAGDRAQAARRRPLARVEQHRGVEALEAGQHAAVGIVHDALGILVGARAEQHADHDVILRTRQILAQ